MGRLFTADIAEGARPMGGGLPKPRKRDTATVQKPTETPAIAEVLVKEADEEVGASGTPATVQETTPVDDAVTASSDSAAVSAQDVRARIASASRAAECLQTRSSRKPSCTYQSSSSRKAAFGRSKMGTTRCLEAAVFEKEHPRILAKDLVTDALKRAREEGEEVVSLRKEYESDAEMHAKVLSSLGIRTNTILGQRVLKPEDVPEMLGVRCSTTARKLFRKNSFDLSLRPAATALSKSGMWPVIMYHNKQAHISEIPTLELCAVVCSRILAVARRQQNLGARSLIFLGVGSGDALVEASIALHLGHVLGQQVVLSKSPQIFTLEDGFKILFLVTDTDEPQKRIESRTSEVFAQMAVQKYDVKEAVADFAKEGVPIYVFCSWPPEKENWRQLIEESSGLWLEELCLLQPPPCLRQSSIEASSSKLRFTELFPKTLCRQDYLSHGFSAGPEVTFHHSHLYVWTPKEVPRPFIATQLEHNWGSFERRMKAIPELEGLHYFHRVGLSHAKCPRDLSERLPDKILTGMKNILFHDAPGLEVAETRKWLREALRFAQGNAKKQLDLLINNSAYRMYQPETEKNGKELVASMYPGVGKALDGGGEAGAGHLAITNKSRASQSTSSVVTEPVVTDSDWGTPESIGSAFVDPRVDPISVKGLDSYKALYGIK